LCAGLAIAAEAMYGAAPACDEFSPTGHIYDAKMIGELPPKEQQDYIDLIGGDSGPGVVIKGGKAPWAHTEHQYGFLPFGDGTNEQRILSTHTIRADTNLTRVDIRLDRLRVYDYPGTGRHFVLFSFAAQNAPTNSGGAVEGINFSQTYEVEESEGAGILGYPIFKGLNVMHSGVSFHCETVNVKNAKDEEALAFLKSGAVSQGLSLLTTAYPAIAPFTEIAKSLGNMVLTRNENRKVQDFYLGLDFEKNGSLGARLCEGDYVVVQAPESLFSWDQCVFDPKGGRIVMKDSGAPIPFNYVIFRVSKHQE